MSTKGRMRYVFSWIGDLVFALIFRGRWYTVASAALAAFLIGVWLLNR